MQELSVSTLVEMTIGLASGLSSEDRFHKLLDAIRKTIQCDCVALLSLQGDTLVPLAMQGLTRDTLGRRFHISEHPRFELICQSDKPVIFDADSPLPDPFDGLLLDHDGDLPMHACMGLPLRFGDTLLGVLTLDSLIPNVFHHIPDRSLEVLSAIAASTLKMALTFNQLEQQAKQVQQRLEELNEEVWERDGGELIGSSTAMTALKADIEVVAPSNFNILIHGETGVGKELVARTLHYRSARRKQPLVYVNCAAIPENLVESELFGHVKGAFTGADKHRSGKFALADGGTLFLDEIGELPLAAQSKILRALQNNEIQPVGQDKVETIDVRVLAATNRDLKQEVNAGRFRADLYHRLSVYPIQVPPLRERNGDIALLAGYFLEQARRKLGITQLKLGRDAMAYISHYDWPGNVRELEHVINRAALKARARSGQRAVITVNLDDIGALENGAAPKSESLPGATPTASLDLSGGLREATDHFQRELVTAALTEADFNWAQAARKLKTDRANLVRLAKRLGINVTRVHKIER
ncbi:MULTISPECIES: nitric oxide reductase transcriptional regulator NorR [unclassified Vibrio]|uniref:nitric oxide reductase transcriptional regulator NorR n=1 Tax=unclassified Vibrio TaxID=2614977 RepID=UPI0013610ACF|nr:MULTISPECIES: nitric oxide reductase transcriptional regulator NorR [unclassified Vibrio]NAW58608.1 nitric oxide reductase transcriptional regulator NorR [Vibrio sp. V36_P2S2PM302]NAX21724.1 nitric oxide reductase transcriptional regulator NorR [Vibrio sp. V39_P1S14PM300]NAX27492.1 nitric oxide reductase transcriptional regulator NorR [Vibrio sp. V38_P2S17PM301]NAX30785.1 nitric oxide reductase transcriptional regulator NorR [Vibrio sp. V37_P2S8PM304]